MKVLLVLEASLGGAGRHVLDLAQGLLDRGAEVHLVYSTLRSDRGFLAGLAALREERPGFRCHSVSITREVAASDLFAYLALSRYVRNEGPFDAIHAHSTKAGFLTRLLVNRRRAKMIYTAHGLMTLDPKLTGLRRRAVRALESALARWSDAVVAVSVNERLCALESGIDPAKLVVIPNGIRRPAADLQARQRSEIRASLGLSADAVCIGFVGRLARQKKPERVVEAFALLKQRTCKPCCVAMIGWGTLEADLRRQAIELGVEKEVLFLGQVDGLSYTPAFDVLAHSSLYEGMSYGFLEALSSGVPIVTTRVGGTDELISAGVTGYVCDPWEPEVFAEYLRVLVDDSELRSAMSVAARIRGAQYDVARMVDSVAELYRRLCARTAETEQVEYAR